MSLDNISEETLAAITKAQTTGILNTTGIYSYDLSELVSLIPVITRFRDIVSRKQSPDGNPYAVWRAMMNVTNSQPDPAVGFDYAGSELLFQEQDFQARYKPLAYAVLVTQDAYDLGKGYGDPYAIATFQALNQLLMAEDKKLVGAQSFALARPAAPTLTDSATLGTLTASSTHYVAVAARTGSGYYFGSGNSRGNSNTITLGTQSAATHSITATVASVRGAVAYDWFYSADNSTWYYYKTTTANAVTITGTIAADAALPSVLLCPDLSTAWKGAASTKPTLNLNADNGSANANDYDGFLASLAGDYNGSGQWTQLGTGTTNPSINNSLDGATLTLSGGTIAELQEYLFMPLWHQVKCSPTALMVNAVQGQKVSDLILGSSSATTFLNTDASGRINVTAGGRIGEVINAPAGGVTVPIEVHTSLPPGTIVARTDRVPFPQANISSVLECRTLRDTAQFDYGISRVANTAGGGPRRESELRTVSAFINRAPVAMAVLQNVG